MTHVELLDDLVLSWNGLAVQRAEPINEDKLDVWFWQWARQRKKILAAQEQGMFLIHCHGCFTAGALRQDMQGVELLKHIRLTPWLGKAQGWHAIVYSFEPLDSILARKPGNLILKSPGVTFLRLPDALDLENALRAAYRDKRLEPGGLEGILQDLAENHRAAPEERSFRPYVAADYQPPDSAHQISNWWGIYELMSAIAGSAHLEYEEQEKRSLLQDRIHRLVIALDTKKVRWLEKSGVARPISRDNGAIRSLIDVATQKKVVYVDDEAEKGWSNMLKALLNDNVEKLACEVMLLPRGYFSKLGNDNKKGENKGIDQITEWISKQNPDLLILDLRLRGPSESFENPTQASGMDVAGAVREKNPYLPILLFTASNKAETILISRSLDIDDYWMKPGLGEHRGLRTPEENLMALVAKLTVLLGPDYQWLRRADEMFRKEIKSERNKLWWLDKYEWPGPNGNGKDPTIGVKRDNVAELVEAILYTARMIFRYGVGSGGSQKYRRPEMVPRILKNALYNHIGQVIELIHGNIASSLSDPYEKAWGSGRIGGYKDQQSNQYVYRRMDWWGYRLYGLRNLYSHVDPNRRSVDKDDVREAISDLLAWLIERPPDMAARTGARFRLHPNDNSGQTPDKARNNDADFREELTKREEYCGHVNRVNELLELGRTKTDENHEYEDLR